jgi:hypothetical protein
MLVKLLRDIGAGAAAGVAVVTVLPLATVGTGAAGAITTLGLVVGTGLGVTAAVVDTTMERTKNVAGGQPRSIWWVKRHHKGGGA